MSTMLLSIKPRYAKVILEGKKQYEFRKSRPKDGVDRIIFYASSPQKQVVGEAAIEVVGIWKRVVGNLKRVVVI